MKVSTYNELISSLLKKYIWFFIILTGTSFFVSYVIFFAHLIWVKSQNMNFSIHPMSFSFRSLLLLQLIVWIMIYFTTKHNSYKSTLFLQVLFKVMITFSLITIYFWALVLTNNLLIKLWYETITSNKYIIYYILSILSNVSIIVILTSILQGYKQKLQNNVFKVICYMVILVFITQIGVYIEALINGLKHLRFDFNNFTIYFQIENLIAVIVTIISSIVWIIFILKLLVNIEKINIIENEDELESNKLLVYNDVLIKGLKNFHLIFIGTIALIIFSMAFSNDLINYFMVNLYDNKDYSKVWKISDYINFLSIISIPNLIALIIEVLMFIWISYLIITNSKKYILIPLITLISIYSYVVIYYLMLITYAIIKANNFNELVQQKFHTIFLPLCVILALTMFLGMIVWNYFKSMKVQIVYLVSSVLIFLLLLNLLITSIITKEFTSSLIFFGQDLFDLSFFKINTLIKIIIGLSTNAFWIGFALSYCRSYRQYKDSLIIQL